MEATGTAADLDRFAFGKRNQNLPVGETGDHRHGVAVLKHEQLFRRCPPGIERHRHGTKFVDAEIHCIEMHRLVVGEQHRHLVTAAHPSGVQLLGDPAAGSVELAESGRAVLGDDGGLVRSVLYRLAQQVDHGHGMVLLNVRTCSAERLKHEADLVVGLRWSLVSLSVADRLKVVLDRFDIERRR